MTLSFGWVDDPVSVQSVLRSIPRPFFAATSAARVRTLPDHVFLWSAARKVLGRLLPARDQGNVGSCVSFGTASAIEHTMLVEIAQGEAEEYRDLVQEAIYGGSRVEVGGGKIRGDGSIGAWAAEYVKRWGLLSRGIYQELVLTSYSEARCRSWGNTGVPDPLEDICRKYPVKDVANTRTWDEAKKSLASGYGIAVCSSQGFAAQRDQDGFARPQGIWPHCMALIGYQTGRREGGFILNSWGERYHQGPTGAGDPPAAGFWAEAEVIDRMLRQGDSWSFAHVEGFPARNLPWIV